MDHMSSRFYQNLAAQKEENLDIRKGPWTSDEDVNLVDYITIHGEGRWNSLARLAGLKRTGKSCRLRWLNYLRPNLRRGNFTIQEQLVILDLHSRFGNRWSRIAQHLPGRTDNEIKNYWRTRVQKQARQLNCDVNSKKFTDIWLPRLMDQLRLASQPSRAHSGAAENSRYMTFQPTRPGPIFINDHSSKPFEILEAQEKLSPSPWNDFFWDKDWSCNYQDGLPYDYLGMFYSPVGRYFASYHDDGAFVNSNFRSCGRGGDSPATLLTDEDFWPLQAQSTFPRA